MSDECLCVFLDNYRVEHMVESMFKTGQREVQQNSSIRRSSVAKKEIISFDGKIPSVKKFKRNFHDVIFLR